MMILCYIDLFALNQYIFTTNSDSDKMDMICKCSMDELPKLLVDSYYSLDSDKIKLLGNKKYIEKIIPEILFATGDKILSIWLSKFIKPLYNKQVPK